MGLEAALLDLRDSLERLTALVAIVARRAQDTPVEQGRRPAGAAARDADGEQMHYLASRAGDAARDADGWLRKARQAVQKARRNVAKGKDLASARHALTQCQHALERFRRGPAKVLLGPRNKEDLADLARRRAEVWGGWVDDLLGALRELRKPRAAVGKALHHCWQELASYATIHQVTIHILAVGPQIIGQRGRQSLRDK
jgi:hypothetical protein